MYHKPKVERFGTVRELTLVGFSGNSDGFTIVGPDGTTVGNGNDCSTGARVPCVPTSS